MTRKEVKDLQKQTEERILAEYAQAKKALESGATIQEGQIPIYLTKTLWIESGDLLDSTPTEICEKMTDFIEEIKNLPPHFGGYFDYSGDRDEDCIYDFTKEYKCTVLVNETEEVLHKIAMTQFKYAIAKALKPTKQVGINRIDCNIFKLFLEESLTFEQLREIVYRKCEI